MAATAAHAALYRELVLAHGRAPRGAGALDPPCLRASAYNALCGDRVTLTLRLDARGCIAALRHASEGCLLCLASASLLSEAARGLDAAQAQALHARLHALVHGEADIEALGDLAALAGVAAHPSRRRCVLLPWEALRDALADEAIDARDGHG